MRNQLEFHQRNVRGVGHNTRHPQNLPEYLLIANLLPDVHVQPSVGRTGSTLTPGIHGAAAGGQPGCAGAG